MTAIDRRRFLAGLAGFALAGDPAAARAREGERYAAARFDRGDVASLALFDEAGRERAAAPLPARAHATAVSPDGRLLVTLGRRPGRYGLVHAASDLAVLGRIDPPEGRHLTGHGVFSADGRRFFTGENDPTDDRGVIGIHDTANGFARIGEWSSAGVGPHDLALASDGRRLIVANGGIGTDPATGRDLVDRATMRPNLTMLELERGEIVAQADLGADLRLSSIRHLAVAADGEVAFGCQFEGDAADSPPLVGVWRPGREAPLLWDMPDPALARLADYIGSVALDATGEIVAASSPRGGHVAFFARATGRFLGLGAMADVCGLAAGAGGFLATSGAAGVRVIAPDRIGRPLAGLGEHVWDNHVTRLPARG